ncbi:MAG: OmpA family protein [Tranquillimonas sp.]
MPLRRTLPALALISLAAGGAVLTATQAAGVIERQSAENVRDRLVAEGHDWVDVQADGLRITLTGTARDEAARFEALAAASHAVDAARITDRLQLAETEVAAPPRFSLEILRNADGVSAIGLIPAATDRAALLQRIAAATGGAEVTDLLESADFPAPPAWAGAVDHGLTALSSLPKSKISVSADRVAVTAIADSRADQRRLESELSRGAPQGVRLALDIAAPRPVITPFTLRFVRDGGEARLETCSAGTAQGRDRILAAAAEAGLRGAGECAVGLGAPSPDWAAAAEAAIGAIGDLGGGSVTITDTKIALSAAQGTEQALFDREVGELEGALPAAFRLDAVLPEPPAPAADGTSEAEPAEFVLTRSPEGLVQLRGRVPDARSRAAVKNLAGARFGAGQVTDATRTAEGLPAGWSPRVLAGIEAMALLNNGALTVTPDRIEISGRTGIREARAEIARLLSQTLGEDAAVKIDVAYDQAMDVELGLPTPEECVAQVNAVLNARKVTFAPGSARIDADARDTLDKVAEVMTPCEDVPMEIGGYTDSQGRESMNLDLSQSRADAVLAALMARRVLTANLTARGYGEENPIADNGTEEGREANRRIEFRLLAPEDTAAAGAEDAPAEQQTEPDHEQN